MRRILVGASCALLTAAVEPESVDSRGNPWKHVGLHLGGAVGGPSVDSFTTAPDAHHTTPASTASEPVTTMPTPIPTTAMPTAMPTTTTTIAMPTTTTTTAMPTTTTTTSTTTTTTTTTSTTKPKDVYVHPPRYAKTRGPLVVGNVRPAGLAGEVELLQPVYVMLAYTGRRDPPDVDWHYVADTAASAPANLEFIRKSVTGDDRFGITIFTFRAKRVGFENLRFQFRRESTGESLFTQQFVVKVKGAGSPRAGRQQARRKSMDAHAVGAEGELHHIELIDNDDDLDHSDDGFDQLERLNNFLSSYSADERPLDDSENADAEGGAGAEALNLKGSVTLTLESATSVTVEIGTTVEVLLERRACTTPWIYSGATNDGVLTFEGLGHIYRISREANVEPDIDGLGVVTFDLYKYTAAKDGLAELEFGCLSLNDVQHAHFSVTVGGKPPAPLVLSVDSYGHRIESKSLHDDDADLPRVVSLDVVKPSAIKEGWSRAVTVRVGDLLKINLPYNGTDGYVWVYFATPELTNPLAYEGSEFVPDRTGINGGSQFLFRGIIQGTAEISFVQRRPWQKTTSGKKVTLVVSVLPRPSPFA